MVHYRPHPIRSILLLLATIALALALAACGNGPARSSTTETTGSGGLMVGQSRAQVESSNPKWTVHTTRSNGPCHVVVYRDYHWSLARGFAHSAEYHHVTYDLHGQVVAWVSNSNPDSTKD